jgi:hypothetical protein
MTDIENRLKKLQNIIDIQASTGNWDYDEYMFGLLNGLLMAKSIFDDQDPNFAEAPPMWIADKTLLDKLNKLGIVINEDC